MVLTVNLKTIFLFFIIGLLVNSYANADALTSLLAGNSCDELEPGQEIVVKTSPNSPSPTGVARRYRLRRDRSRPNVYHVKLNLFFYITPEAMIEQRGESALKDLPPNENGPYVYPSWVISTEMIAKYQNAVRTCFNEMNGKLIAPDANKTEIHLHADFTAPEDRDLYNVINISTGEHRSNSREWSGRIDCPMIIHETLHLLGLVDEYTEHSSASTVFPHAPPDMKLYDCRKRGLYNPMKNPFFDMGSTYRICVYSNTGKPFEMKRVEAMPENCSNAGSNSRYHVRISLDDLQTYRRQQETTDSTIYFMPEVKNFVLMAPAWVRFITKPFCNQENEKYITCSQNAYRTSYEGCIPVPEYCSSSEYFNE